MVATVFVLLVSLLPGLAWLLFFLREDVHPEPKKIVTYTFGIGVVASVLVVTFQLLGYALIPYLSSSLLLTVIYYALIEEVLKFFAAYISTKDRNVLSEPVDFMIYMIAASLGLATIENFFILVDLIMTGGVDILSDIISTISLRFVGATLLHAIASGILGFYWAKSRIENKGTHLFNGFLIATLIHAVFNFLVLSFQGMDYLIYPSLFLLIVGFVLFKDFEKLKIFESNKD